ncbi:hypothetical protein BP6252_02765 [Coleophoma cylindrospora]|uniref:Uncharacterized protein n=1 Tax=Coleophoma cylindrospora TaxID=1849047 RepID=A0A3D8SFQ5_9HELO|nr:hypothetical protein BP6252_02765 [Coleophoma cylindrospora]
MQISQALAVLALLSSIQALPVASPASSSSGLTSLGSILGSTLGSITGNTGNGAGAGAGAGSGAGAGAGTGAGAGAGSGNTIGSGNSVGNVGIDPSISIPSITLTTPPVTVDPSILKSRSSTSGALLPQQLVDELLEDQSGLFTEGPGDVTAIVGGIIKNKKRQAPVTGPIGDFLAQDIAPLLTKPFEISPAADV